MIRSFSILLFLFTATAFRANGQLANSEWVYPSPTGSVVLKDAGDSPTTSTRLRATATNGSQLIFVASSVHDTTGTPQKMSQKLVPVDAPLLTL